MNLYYTIARKQPPNSAAPALLPALISLLLTMASMPLKNIFYKANQNYAKLNELRNLLQVCCCYTLNCCGGVSQQRKNFYATILLPVAYVVVVLLLLFSLY